jgi:hypothetical protein
MQIDAMTAKTVSYKPKDGRQLLVLTVDGCKPQDDLVQPVRGEGAHGPKQTKHKDRKQNSLNGGPKGTVSEQGQRMTFSYVRREGRLSVLYC